MKNFRNKPRGTTIVGLSLDGGRLEGVEVRRSNGSASLGRSFATTLSLDPLTAEPELVGREIRKQLDAAGVRERRCVVCLPAGWALTLSVPVPDLPDADRESFLQIEAERGLPYDLGNLLLAHSLSRAADGSQQATIVAMPRDHIQRWEAVLKAARLKSVSLTLAAPVVDDPRGTGGETVLSLVPGQHNLTLQVAGGGGLAALRVLDGAYEQEGGEWHLQADHILREIRITLGQLPPGLAGTLRRVRVVGAGEEARELAEQLRSKLDTLGLAVESVREVAADAFAFTVPREAQLSPAVVAALQFAAGRPPVFEFRPPQISPWQLWAARYSSRKLVGTGLAVGAAAAVVALAFLVQQLILWHWQSKWNVMKPRAEELEQLTEKTREYSPWYDNSFRSLAVLRRLTEAFPEDGTVSAKNVDFRQPGLVTCSGTARDNQAWLKMLDQLRAAADVADVKVEQIRGRSPMEFTLNFRWQPKGK